MELMRRPEENEFLADHILNDLAAGQEGLAQRRGRFAFHDSFLPIAE
jgi:hypothetical protein